VSAIVQHPSPPPLLQSVSVSRMVRMWWALAALASLPRPAAGHDGCAWYGDWRCGDLCLDSSAYCTCGGDTIRRLDGKWCCPAQGCGPGGCCSGQGGYDEGRERWSGGVTCNGTALSLSLSCRGECNYHPADRGRDYYQQRAYVAACTNSTVCLPEREVCRGEAQCPDGSDLAGAWCRDPARAGVTCPYRGDTPQTRCKMSLPGQCIPSNKRADGSYSCMDRSDEDHRRPYRGMSAGV
jgi:hypothetical protein